MKTELINIALENLNKTTGFNTKWEKANLLDGLLYLNFNQNTKAFNIEIKKEVRPHQIQVIQKQFQEVTNYMLLAERIYPKVKIELQTLGIPYVETNGNIFIKEKGFYILIDTQKPTKLHKQKTNGAFTKTGLKVVFHFLQNPELINQPYRDIAEKTNVGLGTIPKVIKGLMEMNFVLKINKTNYALNNKTELLQLWINGYSTTLRPTLVKRNFRLKKDWKTINLKGETTVWGGEPAGDLITNFLRPEKFILYTKENELNLIKNYALIPDENGEVEVLEMFWENKTKQIYAPTILVYTELILQGGKRNEEVAQKIYNEHIEPNL